jgi:hypothetical protein
LTSEIGEDNKEEEEEERAGGFSLCCSFSSSFSSSELALEFGAESPSPEDMREEEEGRRL